MAHRFTAAISVGALTLIGGFARPAENSGAELSLRDYNSARYYAYQYFIDYLKKYGLGLRTKIMLGGCDLKALAAQVEGDLPKPALYSSERFAADPKLTPFDLPPVEMTLVVAVATQSLLEGYELGYSEAFRGEAKLAPSVCAGAGKVYDEYLKKKTR